MPAEGTCGSIGSQPWAQAPESLTETGPAYQPDAETQERYERAVEDYALGSYRPPEAAEGAP